MKNKKIAWCKGLTKETDERLRLAGIKISKTNKGRIMNDEWRRKLSEAHKGKPLSKEHVKNMSNALTGRKLSEENKKNISKSLKESYKNRSGYWLGKKRSEETRKKISESHKGKIVSLETRQKLREINLGKKRPPELMKRIGKKLKGRFVGPKNHRWKGGRWINKYGVVYIYKPNHPNSNNSNYVFEHRLVWEEFWGQLLPRNYDVHHIDKNSSNNDITNLVVLSHPAHVKLHHFKGDIHPS